MPNHETQPDVFFADVRSPKDARLNFRATSRQEALIRQAASTLDKSVTEFVIESLTVAAEQVLADRRWFQLDEKSWRAFETALERPPVVKPRLQAMLQEPDVSPFADN